LRRMAIAGHADLIGVLFAVQVSTTTWAIGALLGSLGLAFVLKGLSGTSGSATVSVATTLLGPAWIGFGLGFVLLLRDIHGHGRLAAFAVVLAVFADDTFAYIAGRTLGRHKLAPALSPGKTLEGFVAGSLAYTTCAAYAGLRETSRVARRHRLDRPAGVRDHRRPSRARARRGRFRIAADRWVGAAYAGRR